MFFLCLHTKEPQSIYKRAPDCSRDVLLYYKYSFCYTPAFDLSRVFIFSEHDGSPNYPLLPLDGRDECDDFDDQHRRDPAGTRAIGQSVPLGCGVTPDTDVTSVSVNICPDHWLLQDIQNPDSQLSRHILYLSLRHADILRTGAVSAELCKYETVVVVVVQVSPTGADVRSVATATMKIGDLFARRHAFPVYSKPRPRPRPFELALILLTELRYESFTPNHIRVSKNAENFSETMQLAIHTGAFIALQAFPQILPTVLAFEVVLAIYILWQIMHLVFRNKSSPALFGPLYLADSLTGFWSETWHNVFASPCQSIAYNPVRFTLPKYGVPVLIARSLGVVAAFGLMAVFHMYALAPILPRSSLIRIGLFFLLNGIGTVVEAMIWGKKKHWVRAVLAWTFEAALGTWTAESAHIPNGLSKIPWRDMCGPPSEW